MKARMPFLPLLIITFFIQFTSCSQEDDYFQTQAEKNAIVLKKVFSDNSLKYLRVYNFDTATNDWIVIDEVSSYPSESFNIEETFIVLDKNNKAYYNLEYLNYFNIPSNVENKSRIDLYFSFK